MTTAKERSGWLVKHAPLCKTIYGGMELIRWQAKRAEIRSLSDVLGPKPTDAIVDLMLLPLIYIIIGIFEVGSWVAEKLTGPPKPVKSDTPTAQDDDGPTDLVVLTSTGVIVQGHFCGVWNANKQGLKEVELIEKKGEYTLALEFRRRGWLHIPVPRHLVNDLGEIVDLLENKTYDAKKR